jgi:hypothetical protein
MRTRAKVYTIPVALVLMGLAVLHHGAQLPLYDDPNWQAPFERVDVTLENASDLSSRWYEAQAMARTLRAPLVDLGFGVAALGLSLVGLLVLLRVKSAGDLAAVITPREPRTWYAGALIAWFSFVPAQWAYLTYSFDRGDYPWWSDNIMIPGAGALFFAVLGAPIVLLGVNMCIRARRLPVSLWARPLLGGSWAASTVALVAFVPAILVLGEGVRENFFAVPPSVAVIYLLCCGRAAAVSPRAA